MGKRLVSLLVLGAAVAAAPIAVAGLAPPTPKLNTTAARHAALAAADRFSARNPLISAIDFEGCERWSPRAATCGFYGRGKTATHSGVCNITVIVTGERRHFDTKLRVTCKSESLA